MRSRHISDEELDAGMTLSIKKYIRDQTEQTSDFKSVQMYGVYV